MVEDERRQQHHAALGFHLTVGLAAVNQLPEFAAQRNCAGLTIFRVFSSKPDNVTVYIFPAKRRNLAPAPAS
jgi:hypothetical protein